MQKCCGMENEPDTAASKCGRNNFTISEQTVLLPDKFISPKIAHSDGIPISPSGFSIVLSDLYQKNYNLSFFILSTASKVFSLVLNALSLKKPLPLGPNPSPGVLTICVFFNK